MPNLKTLMQLGQALVNVIEHFKKLNWTTQTDVCLYFRLTAFAFTLLTVSSPYKIGWLIQYCVHTSNICLHISVLPDNNGALWASPALLIEMSAPPNCDFIALIIDKMSSSLLTSHFMATSLPPAGLSS